MPFIHSKHLNLLLQGQFDYIFNHFLPSNAMLNNIVGLIARPLSFDGKSFVPSTHNFSFLNIGNTSPQLGLYYFFNR